MALATGRLTEADFAHHDCAAGDPGLAQVAQREERPVRAWACNQGRAPATSTASTRRVPTAALIFWASYGLVLVSFGSAVKWWLS